MNIISEATYNQMKKLIAEYENKSNDNSEQQPYLKIVGVKIEYQYNPNYGDDRICKCGHQYYRHFDSYENMDIVGCKYCQCFTFIEKTPEDDLPKPDDFNLKVLFKDLKIGDTFGCYGDIHLNYGYPKWCICIKDSEDDAHEIGGINFYMNPHDEVFIISK